MLYVHQPDLLYQQQLNHVLYQHVTVIPSVNGESVHRHVEHRSEQELSAVLKLAQVMWLILPTVFPKDFNYQAALNCVQYHLVQSMHSFLEIGVPVQPHVEHLSVSEV